MPAPPQAMPQLDGPPPSPDTTQAQNPSPNASFAGLAPDPNDQDAGGSEMQVTQLKLQITQSIAQGLDMLGKMDPNLGPLSSQLMQMLKDGVRTSLQQGLGTPETSHGSSSFGQMAGMTQS